MSSAVTAEDIRNLLGDNALPKDVDETSEREQPGGSADDPADGDRPARARDGDARGDADGSDGDPERTAWARERNRIKRANQRISRENRFLAEELQAARSRLDGLERYLVDQASGSIASSVEAAEIELKKAIDDGDSDGVLAALRKRDQAKENLRAAQSARQDAPSPRVPTAGGPPDDAPKALRDWMDRNDWFDWNLGDDDSRMVNQISRRVMAEKGLTLADPELYNEVTKRMRVINPALFDDGGEPDLPRTAGTGQRAPAGAAAGGARASKPSEAELALARRVGIDTSDPKQMERYLRNRAERLAKSGGR